MKAKIKVAVGVLAILAAVYWAVTSVIPINYTGSNIMFPIGGGHVVVRHSGSEAIPIEIRSGERAATFRVESPAIGLAQSATRQGSGRNAFYSVHFDLPPGETRIDVTRGSGLNFISRSDTRIEAVVTPLAAGTIRWILIISGAVIVWAIYFISSATEHRWINKLRGRASSNTLQPKQTTT